MQLSQYCHNKLSPTVTPAGTEVVILDERHNTEHTQLFSGVPPFKLVLKFACLEHGIIKHHYSDVLRKNNGYIFCPYKCTRFIHSVAKSSVQLFPTLPISC